MILSIWFLFLSPFPAQSGFWEGMLTPPQLSERYPADSAKIVWDKPDLKILCVVQIMDGLGRRQAEEINRFKDRLEGKATLILASIDRDESKKWPLEYIGVTWDRLKLTVPIYDLPPAARKGLYEGFDSKRVRTFPQVLFFNSDQALLRIVEGFQTAEALETVFAEVQSAASNPDTQPDPPGLILVNGDFKDWPAGNLLPAGWEVRESSAATVIHTEHPPGTPVGVAEIRKGTSGKRQILFQRIPNSSALQGKKVRLTAVARSNCIGRPVVALAMPTNEGGRYRFAPESPFITREGKEIALRILTACDFGSNTMAWETLTRETLIPDKCKLLVVAVYLEDAEGRLTAGQFDRISVEVLEN